MEDKYLNNIYYRKSKISKRRKTIVLLHGICSSSSAWKNYEILLSKKYNLIIPDIRGCGKSIRPRKTIEYSIDKLAEDIRYILKEEGVKKANFVGSSSGNHLIFELAKKRPSIISKIIFINANYKPSLQANMRFYRAISYFWRFFQFIPGKKFGKNIDYTCHNQERETDFFRVSADFFNTGLKSLGNTTWHYTSYDATKILNKIKLPCLIVNGKNDGLTYSSSSEFMHGRIKKSRIHMIVLTHRKEIIKIIEDFIRS